MSRKYRQITRFEWNEDEKYIDLFGKTNIRVPFYDVRKISIFEDRISIAYMKSMVATCRMSTHEIRVATREIPGSIQVRDAT